MAKTYRRKKSIHRKRSKKSKRSLRKGNKKQVGGVIDMDIYDKLPWVVILDRDYTNIVVIDDVTYADTESHVKSTFDVDLLDYYDKLPVYPKLSMDLMSVELNTLIDLKGNTTEKNQYKIETLDPIVKDYDVFPSILLPDTNVRKRIQIGDTVYSKNTYAEVMAKYESYQIPIIMKAIYGKHPRTLFVKKPRDYLGSDGLPKNDTYDMICSIMNGWRMNNRGVLSTKTSNILGHCDTSNILDDCDTSNILGHCDTLLTSFMNDSDEKKKFIAKYSTGAYQHIDKDTLVVLKTKLDEYMKSKSS